MSIPPELRTSPFMLINTIRTTNLIKLLPVDKKKEFINSYNEDLQKQIDVLKSKDMPHDIIKVLEEAFIKKE